MPELVISDASCLILLTNIGELDLLQQLYGRIWTTPTVAAEYGQSLPEWIEVEAARDQYRQQLLAMQLDAGESSAIALALEKADCTLILDDRRARRVAEQLRIQITGILGVLLKAKQRGVITAVKPLLDRIRQTNFRISAELETQVLKLAGEL
jgi:predicted nucleic acid-binding protein